MKIFDELGSKIFWFIVGISCLSLGYFFVVKFLLNPPKANIVTAPIATQTTNSPQSTETNTEVKPIDLPKTNPTDWNPELREASEKSATIKTSKKVIPIPKNLERGAVLSIYYNEIEEANPQPHLYEPKFQINAPNLNFASWYPENNEFQEVKGYFYVAKNDSYDFFISRAEAIDNYQNQNQDIKIISLSINGFEFLSHEGGAIELEEGWHHVSLIFNPPINYKNPKELFASQVGVWWAEKNSQKYQPLIVYREVKVTSDFQEDEKQTERNSKVSVR